MDSCMAVEQELEKATSRFTILVDDTNKVLDDLIIQVEDLKNEISKQPPNTPLSQSQTKVVHDLAASVKSIVFKLSSDHRDQHQAVSKVGKSIDKHFIADYAAVAPKAESFCSDNNKPIMEQAIAQHLYRQGLDEVGDALVSEAGVTAERGSTFAQLQRCAAALCDGDPGPALGWAASKEHELVHSPLPFTLHRMQLLKLARTHGVSAVIEYARAHLPVHAARHERALQEAVCALAWCTTGASAPPPPHYAHLLDVKALGEEAAELFVREACALLRLAPHSPLAGAVAAGVRVLSALHDIRLKISHPHALVAWTGDDLPLEVELGEEGGGYHSVFACPILRQQASDLNPPMRLLCGHVISRDALTKLTMGLKLKCPYCPMEQSPSEARQIYFS